MMEGSLRLIREFVNTHDFEEGTEALAGPDDLATWLRHNDLLEPGEPVTAADLARALGLREAVRELLTANHDARSGPEPALAKLNAAARRGRLRPEFTPAGTVRLVPAAAGVDRAIGALLAVVAEAMTDGRWGRLKVCRNDACRWAFYDTSRSGAGKWCSMAICGNRNKAAAWRARERERRRG
jgi:predicted RNA-binding Zn ribbon-like protein